MSAFGVCPTPLSFIATMLSVETSQATGGSVGRATPPFFSRHLRILLRSARNVGLGLVGFGDC